VRGLLRESKAQPGPHRGTKSFNTPLPPFILSLSLSAHQVYYIHPTTKHITHFALRAYNSTQGLLFNQALVLFIFIQKQHHDKTHVISAVLLFTLNGIYFYLYTHTLSQQSDIGVYAYEHFFRLSHPHAALEILIILYIRIDASAGLKRPFYLFNAFLLANIIIISWAIGAGKL